MLIGNLIKLIPNNGSIHIYIYILTLYFSRVPTQPDLVIAFHPSLSIISILNSSSSQSQSLFNISMNFLGFYELFGFHKTKLCASSSVFFMQ